MIDNRRWWALAAIMLSMLTIGFDATIMNVALPTLATALHAGTDGLQWIVNAYTLVFAGLLLPMGVLGDRHGRKRLMVIGLLLFGGASVVATRAGSVGALIGARAFMGAAAAVLTPIGMAVIPVMFPPRERAKAISYAAMGIGVGIPLGPIIGGYLLRHFWWGSIFLINVPVVVLGLIAVGALVPESRDPAPRAVDGAGGVLSTAGLVSLVYGVIEVPQRGWGDGLVVGSIVLGVTLLAAFVIWERRIREPMIDLGLFARRRFLWGSVAMTVASFALFGLLFVLPQYLQDVRGNDAFGTGVRLLPMMAGLIVGARISELLGRMLGAKVTVAAGMLLIAGGLALGAATSIHSRYGFVATWLPILGAGTGVALAPAMDAVLGDLPPERSGAGSALTMALRQVGGALGVALLGSLLSGAYRDHIIVTGVPRQAVDAAKGSVAGAVAVAGRLHDVALAASARATYVHAMDVVLVVCGGVSLLGAVLTMLFLPARAAQSSAEEDRISVEIV